MLDPCTLQTTDISSKVYWRSPIHSLAQANDLVEFIVIDIEPLEYRGAHSGKWLLADATLRRASDFGTEHVSRTHLGHLLRVGDSVMGYMLKDKNWNSAEFAAMESSYAYGSKIVRKLGYIMADQLDAL